MSYSKPLHTRNNWATSTREHALHPPYTPYYSIDPPPNTPHYVHNTEALCSIHSSFFFYYHLSIRHFSIPPPVLCNLILIKIKSNKIITTDIILILQESIIYSLFLVSSNSISTSYTTILNYLWRNKSLHYNNILFRGLQGPSHASDVTGSPIPLSAPQNHPASQQHSRAEVAESEQQFCESLWHPKRTVWQILWMVWPVSLDIPNWSEM